MKKKNWPASSQIITIIIERKLIKSPRKPMSELALEMNMARTTVQFITKKKLGFHGRVAQKVPEVTPKQLSTAKTNLRKMSDKRFSNKIVIIDDETYLFRMEKVWTEFI